MIVSPWTNPYLTTDSCQRFVAGTVKSLLPSNYDTVFIQTHLSDDGTLGTLGRDERPRTP